MNTRILHRDFADTLLASTAGAPAPRVDTLEQMARDDAADWTLLRLVLCTAAATLMLALACGLVA